MTFYNQLISDTAPDAAAFQAIPLIQRVLKEGADRPTYLDFLAQAYHHVRHTCPLLALALSRIDRNCGMYRAALLDYIEEEKGHEEWILDDIAALGGDADAVRRGEAHLACRTMVSHAYFLTDRVDPHCLLGMVHVLEGQSVALAEHAADRLSANLAGGGRGGFSYLYSHGGLDQEHVVMFANLLDSLEDDGIKSRIIAATRDFYVLYGNVFRDLDLNRMSRDAA